MFIAKIHGGELDGTIYESPYAASIADVLLSDAGMMEVEVVSPGGQFAHHVTNADALAHFLYLWNGGEVRIGVPHAADSMLVHVETVVDGAQVVA